MTATAPAPTIYVPSRQSGGVGYQVATVGEIESGRFQLFVRAGESYAPATVDDVRRSLGVLKPAAPAWADGFVPSAYQQAIFDFLASGEGDGFVDAVAGSGKSTTLKRAAQRIRLATGRRGLVCAFNYAIAEEMKNGLPPGWVARTIHSLGRGIVEGALGRCEPNDHKYTALIRAFMVEKGHEDPEGEIALAIGDLLRYVQSSLTHPMDLPGLQALVAKHEIEVADAHRALVLDAVAVVLRQGVRIALDERIISFGDMLWLPHVLSNPAMTVGAGLRPRATYPWVFTDEAQDLSPAQLAIALKYRAPGGRMLFCGDAKQAIYAFAGADCKSVDTIVAATNATRLPLSVCYRCPAKHIALAKKLVPHIEARPGAPEGVLETVPEDQMLTMVRPGDLVICRNTAPLVALCFKLVEQRVPARVRGKDIGESLVKLMKRIARMADDRGGATWPVALDMYQAAASHAFGDAKDAEKRREALADQVNSLRFIYEGARPNTVDAFEEAITRVFSQGQGCVDLATIHRAKGDERDRVFFLHPERCPSPAATTAEALAQEKNLIYVAQTRAKAELYLVPEASKK